MPSKLVIQLLGEFQSPIMGKQSKVLARPACSPFWPICSFITMFPNLAGKSHISYGPIRAKLARNNLRQLIYQLRQTLPDPIVF